MEEAFLRIDTHTHSCGVSKCSKVTPEQIIVEKRKLGYDGVILTNHCQAWYYPPEQHGAYIEAVIAEYKKGKAYADTLGFAFWLGLEVTLNVPAYADYLLFGVTEGFLRRTPCLYQLTQKELYALCKENGVTLIQAHPLRHEGVGDTDYLDGIEINCTPADFEKREEIVRIANNTGLVVTCGTDYHFPERDIRAGMLVPKTVKNSVDFGKYLLEMPQTNVFIYDEVIKIPAGRNAKKLEK
ncbi:MAG: PHP domain-containing protein [Clostridia bacterium]|nr:PHP domain-containing protein [Clostridia bacterium]